TTRSVAPSPFRSPATTAAGRPPTAIHGATRKTGEVLATATGLPVPSAAFGSGSAFRFGEDARAATASRKTQTRAARTKRRVIGSPISERGGGNPQGRRSLRVSRNVYRM